MTTRWQLGASAAFCVAVALTASPVVAQGLSLEQERQDRLLRERQERDRRERLEDVYRRQRERAEQATRERKRAVEEGADRAAREYYGTARGSSSRRQRGTSTRRVSPLAGGGGAGLSKRCRRWLALCRKGRSGACQNFDKHC